MIEVVALLAGFAIVILACVFVAGGIMNLWESSKTWWPARVGLWCFYLIGFIILMAVIMVIEGVE